MSFIEIHDIINGDYIFIPVTSPLNVRIDSGVTANNSRIDILNSSFTCTNFVNFFLISALIVLKPLQLLAFIHF